MVSIEFDDVRGTAEWMNAFLRQVPDALAVVSHEVHGTAAVVSCDPEIAEQLGSTEQRRDG